VKLGGDDDQAELGAADHRRAVSPWDVAHERATRELASCGERRRRGQGALVDGRGGRRSRRGGRHRCRCGRWRSRRCPLLLAAAALLAVALALPYRRQAVACAAVGLVGILAVRLAGLLFLMDGQSNGASCLMALGVLVAVAVYVAEIVEAR